MRIAEYLIDLGEAGVLALTQEGLGSWNPPFPAQRLGRFRLFNSSGTHDRLDLFTRAVSRTTFDSVVAHARARLARAVPVVLQQIEWLARHASDDYREAASQVLPLGGGLVLLVFSAATHPRTFRLVDVSRGVTLWETSFDELTQATGLQPKPTLGESGTLPILHAAGGQHAEIWMHLTSVILEWTGTTMRPLTWNRGRYGLMDTQATASHLILKPDRDRNGYLVLDAATGAEVGRFDAPTKSSHSTIPHTSPGTERIVLPAANGTIDVVDGFGERSFSVRPYARVGRNDSFGVKLSHGGRYVGVRQWQSFRVVDLERRLVAEIESPIPLLADDPSREVTYDSCVIASDSGLCVVEEGRVEIRPYDSLRWEPVLEPGKRSSSKASLAPAEFEKHVSRWTRPALTLKPVKKGGGRSRLYGLPDLPEADIPRHEGQPMLLLAQIALEEVATLMPENPWPKEGVLCFFTAIDGEGEVLQDEMFNPLVVRVIWRRGPVEYPAKEGAAPAPQPLKLSVHKANLPDITSLAVAAEAMDDDAIEAYRSHLEAKGIAEQPSGHRLGGYPTILQNNDLEAQAAHFADEADYPPQDREAFKAAARWRLLLQMDSDDVFMWGTDSGTLYFLIHDDDLARGDFGRVVALSEGYGYRRNVSRHGRSASGTIRLQDLKRRSFRLVPPSHPTGGSVVAVNSLLIIVTVAALGLRAPSQYI